MTPSAKIGFHAASINGQEKGTGNALFGAYMTRLGLDYEAVLWATTASPSEIAFLTPAQAERLGIDVLVINEGPDEKQANAQPTLPFTPRPVTPQPVKPQQNGGQPKSIPPVGQVTSLSANPHPYQGDSSIESQVAFLATYYFAAWNNNYWQGLSLMYGDEVRYFDKMIPKAEVIADKQKFAERWPNRDYRVRRDSLSVRCNGTSTWLDDCAVWGVVEWTASNSANRSTGSANFQFGLGPYPRGVPWRGIGKIDLRIGSETTVVIERKVVARQ
jgi:hypothetical protein